MRYNDFHKYTPFNCGVVCTADPSDATIPDFRLAGVHGIENGIEMKLESLLIFNLRLFPPLQEKYLLLVKSFP